MKMENMITDSRGEVLVLINKKDKIEQEIREWGQILSQNGVGMTDSLVDAEGFPLAHVDIYQVRHARQKIICLQNDHKAIMKEIEQGLGQYYSGTASNASANITVTSTDRPDYSHLEAFAKISNVVHGSPADEAGLQNDDLVLQFGSVNAGNYKDITTIADVVKHSENVEILLRIRRASRVTSIQLRPHKWNGKGLLGCVITSIETVDR